MMPRPTARPLTSLAACVACLAAAASPRYVNDFSAEAVGRAPKDVQVAAGAFIVAEKDGNRFLEIPGEPLDTFGLLYGPAQPPEASASAKVSGDSTGRRFPDIGVGLGDISGYRLMLLPGPKKLELRKGDDPVAAADLPAPWTPGSWTQLRLRVRKTGDKHWKVEGKAWPGGQPEPEAWPVTTDTSAPPPAGRASVWAVPFSGKPIRFDDLTAD